MSQSRRRRALGAGAVSVGMVAAVAITTAPAMGAPQYTRIDQSSMTAVAADSVENSGEGANGPIGLAHHGDDLSDQRAGIHGAAERRQWPGQGVSGVRLPRRQDVGRAGGLG